MFFLRPTSENLERCGTALRAGQLVAFPTETVYGLGANAWDPKACEKIYHHKGRPWGDPLIVHVATYQEAWPLWNLEKSSSNSRVFLEHLGRAFWPGPLTLVYDAADRVPDVVCGCRQRQIGGPRTVGVRIPSGRVARRLLQAARVPLAAPSANRFGHISPTHPVHVADDFKDAITGPLWILTEGTSKSKNERVGVESTVLRLHRSPSKSCTGELLRCGKISLDEVRACLQRHGFALELTPSRKSPNPRASPGQYRRHYAPHLPTWLLPTLPTSGRELQNLRFSRLRLSSREGPNVTWSQAVLVDYGNQFKGLKPRVRAYFKLTTRHDADRAARVLYATLRRAEQVEHARMILVPDLRTSQGKVMEEVLADRLERAASGKRCVWETCRPFRERKKIE